MYLIRNYTYWLYFFKMKTRFISLFSFLLERHSSRSMGSGADWPGARSDRGAAAATRKGLGNVAAEPFVGPLVSGYFRHMFQRGSIGDDDRPFRDLNDAVALPIAKTFVHAFARAHHHVCQFLALKRDRYWRPLLGRLKAMAALPDDWEEIMRSALFCCPTLVMSQLPGGARSPSVSLLGFAAAVTCGSEPEGASGDAVSGLFTDLRRAVA